MTALNDLIDKAIAAATQNETDIATAIQFAQLPNPTPAQVSAAAQQLAVSHARALRQLNNLIRVFLGNVDQAE